MKNLDELKKYITVGLFQIVNSFVIVLERAKIESTFGHQAILDYKGLKKGSISYCNIIADDVNRKVQLDGLLENHLAKIQKQYIAVPLYAVENGVLYEIANGKPSEMATPAPSEPKELTLEEVENQIKELNKLKKELKKVTE